MKNSSQFKSVQSQVSEIISQFGYKDFEPKANLGAVREKFLASVSKYDDYWIVSKDLEYTEWCILALKSHNPKHHLKTKICFNFVGDRLRVVVCNEPRVLMYLSEDETTTSSAIKVNHSIFYRDIWRNHENLYIELLDVFERSLVYADRKEEMSSFPSSGLTLNEQLDEECV